ncbi:hypothetical protein [Streptosporangium sp. NPDC003464]
MAGLAARVDAEQQRSRAGAEQVSAVGEQVHADLAGERDRLAVALPALQEAELRHQAARARLRRAERTVSELKATL